MPLLKDSTGRQLYVLRKKSTNQILNHRTYYPNIDETAPIVGLDPDLEYLPIDQDLPLQPDTNLFNVLTEESKDETAGTWRIRYSAQRKPNLEIKTRIANRRAVELYRHVGQQELAELNLLSNYVLYRGQKGLILSNKEKKLMDRVAAVGQALWKNLQVSADKDAVVDANGEPDMNADWEAPTPVDPPPPPDVIP